MTSHRRSRRSIQLLSQKERLTCRDRLSTTPSVLGLKYPHCFALVSLVATGYTSQANNSQEPCICCLCLRASRTFNLSSGLPMSLLCGPLVSSSGLRNAVSSSIRPPYVDFTDVHLRSLTPHRNVDKGEINPDSALHRK